ncbi:MAG: hypothetical protein NTX15_09540 [Candidatus Kapabacteria bacterium]|nr:hypothetical protein [Candidatus Kapabacteria bacterium]
MVTFENAELSSYCMGQCVYRMIVLSWLYDVCEAPDNVVELRPKRVLVSKRIGDHVVNVVLDLKRRRPEMVTAYITIDDDLVRRN